MWINLILAGGICLGSQLEYAQRLQRLVDGDIVKHGDICYISIDGFSFPPTMESVSLPQLAFYSEDNCGNLEEAAELLEYAKQTNVYGDFLYLWNFLKYHGEDADVALDWQTDLASTVREFLPQLLPVLIFSTSNAKIRTYYLIITTTTEENTWKDLEEEGFEYDFRLINQGLV